MNKIFKIPPESKSHLTDPELLANRLKILIGAPFKLSGKTRSDGSNIRKLVASELGKYELPEAASVNEFEIIPPKKKGIPKILREFIDTYIVTGGDYYNLQVWNRFPTSDSVLVDYIDSEGLAAKDIRFIFVKVDKNKNKISSVIILSPEYIEDKFGSFGKPTIKHQLIISNKFRNNLLNSPQAILYFDDTQNLKKIRSNKYTPPQRNFNDFPESGEIYGNKIIFEKVARKIIDLKIPVSETKNRGQFFETLCLKLLGYEYRENDLLEGGYPDIRHQLLEIKIQDSPTVDLGKYSPEFDQIIMPQFSITTKDIRYLIALTDSVDLRIKAVVLCPGEKLGSYFTYISDKSFKCQRSIPMTFFNKHEGESVFNP